jgi:murein L,D-transpeptidase YafK
MKEIAHILTEYYMWWKQWNAKYVEKKPQEKTLDKDIASNVAI